MTPQNTAITIRVGHGTLSFSTTDADGAVTTHPYAVKSGMSMAANLRAALRGEPALTQGYSAARLVVATPPLLIPMEEYHDQEDFDVDSVYGETITGHKGETKIITEMPELNVVSIFPVNSDLLMVVQDNFQQVETENVMTAMWLHLYNKYYKNDGNRRLFIYFHDKMMDVCSYDQHRIRFANSFNAQHAHDALYFTLFVWKQLGMNQEDDELFVIGKAPHEDWLTERLQNYIKKVHIECE